MTLELLLLGITLLAAFGWWRAMVHWRRACDREKLLLELVRKLIAQLPSITEQLEDMAVRETRH